MFNRTRHNVSTRIRGTIANVNQAWASHPNDQLLPLVANAELGLESAMTRFLMLPPPPLVMPPSPSTAGCRPNSCGMNWAAPSSQMSTRRNASHYSTGWCWDPLAPLQPVPPHSSCHAQLPHWVTLPSSTIKDPPQLGSNQDSWGSHCRLSSRLPG
jgi:hypothetical protein